jgi:hypothetical protein
VRLVKIPWRYILTLGGAWLYDKLVRKRLPSGLRQTIDRFVKDPHCAPIDLRADLELALQALKRARSTEELARARTRLESKAAELDRYLKGAAR